MGKMGHGPKQKPTWFIWDEEGTCTWDEEAPALLLGRAHLTHPQAPPMQETGSGLRKTRTMPCSCSEPTSPVTACARAGARLERLHQALALRGRHLAVDADVAHARPACPAKLGVSCTPSSRKSAQGRVKP